jgi:hypothetical protein
MKTIAEEIQGWIEDASIKVGVQVSIVPSAEARELITLIMERYVFGRPTWWWDQLKLPCVQFDRKTVRLSEILPSLEGNVYLIPEYPNHDGPVFLVSAHGVEAILNHCPIFEYSILDRRADWLITESHHDVLYVCRWVDASHYVNENS